MANIQNTIISKQQASSYEKIYPFWQIKTENGIVLAKKHNKQKLKSGEVKISEEKDLLQELNKIEKAHFIYVILEFGNSSTQCYDRFDYICGNRVEYDKIKKQQQQTLGNVPTNNAPAADYTVALENLRSQILQEQSSYFAKMQLELERQKLEQERQRLEQEHKFREQMLIQNYQNLQKQLEDNYKAREQMLILRKEIDDEKIDNEYEKLETEAEELEKKKETTKEVVMEVLKGIPSLLGLFTGAGSSQKEVGKVEPEPEREKPKFKRKTQEEKEEKENQ